MDGEVDRSGGRKVSHTSPFNLTFSSSYTPVSYHLMSPYAADLNSHYTAHTTSPTASSLYTTQPISLHPFQHDMQNLLPVLDQDEREHHLRNVPRGIRLGALEERKKGKM